MVGYSKLKHCVRLLFWSGQSFDEADLKPEGTFKAAEARYVDAEEVNTIAQETAIVDRPVTRPFPVKLSLCKLCEHTTTVTRSTAWRGMPTEVILTEAVLTEVVRSLSA